MHIFSYGDNSSATLAIDLESNLNPTPPLILQQRDYDHWVVDYELEMKVSGDVIHYEKW